MIVKNKKRTDDNSDKTNDRHDDDEDTDILDDVLTDDKKLYKIEVDQTNEIIPMRYGIPNINGFFIQNGVPSGETGLVDKPSIIIRTEEKKYYTDFNYNNNGYILRQIVNKETE